MVSRGLERLRYSVRSMTLGLIFLPTRGGLCQPIRDDPIDSRIETHTTVAATDLNILGPMILLHFSADSPVNNPIAFTVDRRQRNGWRLIGIHCFERFSHLFNCHTSLLFKQSLYQRISPLTIGHTKWAAQGNHLPDLVRKQPPELARINAAKALTYEADGACALRKDGFKPILQSVLHNI